MEFFQNFSYMGSYVYAKGNIHTQRETAVIYSFAEADLPNDRIECRYRDVACEAAGVLQ